MRWAWVAWILAIVASFAVLEGFALATDRHTLSRFVWETSQAWPLLPWIVGNLTGGLAVHFWWNWDPRHIPPPRR